MAVPMVPSRLRAADWVHEHVDDLRNVTSCGRTDIRASSRALTIPLQRLRSLPTAQNGRCRVSQPSQQ